MRSSRKEAAVFLLVWLLFVLSAAAILSGHVL